jgi:hypothetical protein
MRRPPCPKGVELIGVISIPRKQLLKRLVVGGHRFHHKWKVQERTRSLSTPCRPVLEHGGI